MSVRVILRLLKSKYILIEDTKRSLKIVSRTYAKAKILILDTSRNKFGILELTEFYQNAQRVNLPFIVEHIRQLPFLINNKANCNYIKDPT